MWRKYLAAQKLAKHPVSVSKTRGRKVVWVQVPLPAPNINLILFREGQNILESKKLLNKGGPRRPPLFIDI